MIHLRSPFGRSPLTLACEAIGTAMALDRHAAKLFGRGARPSGALLFSKGMGEAAVKAARAAWRATHEGENADCHTAILYDGADFKPFTFSSTDAQFLENRKFQILEICRAFRVPPSMLFDHDRATWSNTEQMGREFLSYTLEPWLRATKGALRRALFTDEERGSYVIRFDRR
jgi:HK97 family phage portal protein